MIHGNAFSLHTTPYTAHEARGKSREAAGELDGVKTEIFGREPSFGKIVLIPCTAEASPSVENTEASKKFRPRKTGKGPERFFGEKSRERRGEAAFLPLF